MSKDLSDSIKTGFEIGQLACKLDFENQCYVMGTINALLFIKEQEENNKGGK